MNHAKNQYVPPMAEVIFLVPCENLAAWDWKFGSTWEGQKYFQADGNLLASGIAMGGLLETEDFLQQDGFVIKTK